MCHGRSARVIAGRLCELLKFLLCDNGLIFACMMVIGNNSIDVFNDGPNRGRRPIRHTVGILDIFRLLIDTHLSLIVRAKLTALIVLFSS